MKRAFGRLVAIFACAASLMNSPALSSPLTGSVAPSGGCSMPDFRQARLPSVLDMPAEYAGNSNAAIIDQIGNWTLYLMGLSAEARISAAKRTELVQVLVESAQVNLAQWPKNIRGGTGRGDSVASHTQQILMVSAVAYVQNKDQFGAEEQAIVESWLERMLHDLEKGPQLRNWKKTDGKRITMGSLWSVVGYALGDGNRVNKGFKVYQETIRSIREDGSIPVVTGRGGMAIFYQNAAAASLAVIADIAEAQGKELYAFEVDGRSFHKVVESLIRATKDPNLVADYANTNGWQEGSTSGYSPTRQLINWTDSDMGIWLHLYVRRFGDTPLGQELRAMSPLLRSGSIGTMEQVGGNARCFAGAY